MGAYLSKPVTEKHSTDGEKGEISYGACSMQGWRVSQEVTRCLCLGLAGGAWRGWGGLWGLFYGLYGLLGGWGISMGLGTEFAGLECPWNALTIGGCWAKGLPGSGLAVGAWGWKGLCLWGLGVWIGLWEERGLWDWVCSGSGWLWGLWALIAGV